MKTVRLLLIMILISLLVLVACTKTPQKPSPPSPESQESSSVVQSSNIQPTRTEGCVNEEFRSLILTEQEISSILGENLKLTKNERGSAGGPGDLQYNKWCRVWYEKESESYNGINVEIRNCCGLWKGQIGQGGGFFKATYDEYLEAYKNRDRALGVAAYKKVEEVSIPPNKGLYFELAGFKKIVFKKKDTVIIITTMGSTGTKEKLMQLLNTIEKKIN